MAIAVSFSSCYKKKDTIAILTFVDQDGNGISGLEIKVDYGDGNDPSHREGLTQTGTTGGSGKVLFNFNELYKSGQAGVFVLDVFVNGTAVGIIRVEQEETVEEIYEL